MSENTSGIRNLVNKKIFILISLILITSFTEVSCLKYNRGPLEDAYPSRTIENVDSDDEFTGSTYIEPTKGEDSDKSESLLQLSQLKSNPPRFGDDVDDDDDDEDDDEDEPEDEETEDFLDRADESSLLEVRGESFMQHGDVKKGERVNDNKLKEYLTKIGAIDRIKKAKAKGKQTISNVKNKIRSIPGGVRKIKNKIIPPNPYYTTLRPEKENKVPHGKRLLNTINEVDEQRKKGGSKKQVPHGKRLLNTMNEVDGIRRSRETLNNVSEGKKVVLPRKVLHIMKDENDGIEEKEPPRYGRLRTIKQKKR